MDLSGRMLQPMDSRYVLHGHENMQAFHKPYLEALRTQQNQHCSSPLFGRLSGLNYIYVNPTYGREIECDIISDKRYVSSLLDELQNMIDQQKDEAGRRKIELEAEEMKLQ
uniref:Uncharacterized protein n=1 Tax=Tanacetum cinerariifolium TaxID=118510 RepID=A0A699HPR3_TANCI|nr:hypothetical protein [Tanacetum cinerariifolium]